MKNENDTITVRDRRKPRQFSIDNSIIDQWFPLIGPTGYAFYSLLVRLARRDTEMAFPGYTLISKHLGVSRSTVNAYAKFLAICGLIHIRPGNSHRSNTYFILEPPQVTREKLIEILKGISRGFDLDDRYRGTFEKRVKSWRPLQAHFRNANAVEPETQSPVQLQIFEGGTPAEHPSTPIALGGTPAEHPSTPIALGGSTAVPEQSKFNKGNGTIPMEQSESVVVGGDILSGSSFFENFTRATSRVESKELAQAFDQAGIMGEATRRDIVMRNPDVTPEDVKAWAAYRDEENRRRPGSCSTAVIISYLRSGQRPPERFYDHLDDFQITINQ